MQRIIAFLPLVLFHFALNAQIGINNSYNFSKFDVWDVHVNAIIPIRQKVFDNSLSHEIDYRFILTNKKISIIPSFSYHKASSNYFQSSANSLTINQLSFGISSNVYLLNLNNQIERNLISNGLYVSLGIGLTHSEKEYRDIAGETTINGSFKMGIGLDFILNKWLCITPFVSVIHFPNISWNEIIDISYAGTVQNNGEFDDTSGRLLAAGIRLGVQF